MTMTEFEIEEKKSNKTWHLHCKTAYFRINVITDSFSLYDIDLLQEDLDLLESFGLAPRDFKAGDVVDETYIEYYGREDSVKFDEKCIAKGYMEFDLKVVLDEWDDERNHITNIKAYTPPKS